MVPRSAPVPSMSRGSAADRKRIDRSRWQTPISDALVTAGILHAYSVVSARILRAADARRAPLFRVLDGTANVGGSTWGFIASGLFRRVVATEIVPSICERLVDNLRSLGVTLLHRHGVPRWSGLYDSADASAPEPRTFVRVLNKSVLDRIAATSTPSRGQDEEWMDTLFLDPPWCKDEKTMTLWADAADAGSWVQPLSAAGGGGRKRKNCNHRARMRAKRRRLEQTEVARGEGGGDYAAAARGTLDVGQVIAQWWSPGRIVGLKAPFSFDIDGLRASLASEWGKRVSAVVHTHPFGVLNRGYPSYVLIVVCSSECRDSSELRQTIRRLESTGRHNVR